MAQPAPSDSEGLRPNLTWRATRLEFDGIDCCIVDPDFDTDIDPESWDFLGR